MATFIMLTRLDHGGALTEPGALQDLNDRVSDQLRSDCPDVVWKANYALLGPADYLDIFTAPDIEAAMRVAKIVRTTGRASTEIWGALDWERYAGPAWRARS